MEFKNFRQQFVSTALLIMLAIPFIPLSVSAGAPVSEPAPVIRVAPPAPVFDDGARIAELAARRKRVAEQIGPKSVLIMFSAEPRVYTNDVDYEFRQENNLFYLTHLKQKGATLVLMPGNAQTPEILFLPRRDPAAETWTGYMYSPEQARKVSGIAEIWEAKEFEPFVRSLRARRAYRPESKNVLLANSTNATGGAAQPVTPPVPKSEVTTAAAQAAIPAQPVTGQSAPNLRVETPAATGANVSASATTQPATTITTNTAATNATVPTSSPTSGATGFETLFAAMQGGEGALYLLIPGGEGESREYKQEQKSAAQWAQSATGLTVRNAFPIFAEMRLRKSEAELKILQHAIDITIEALGRAMGMAGRAQWEYEVEAEVEYTFKRRNADFWGYPSIVGCGPNATTLHYETSQSQVKSGDLLLMDVGAEYHHYTADVTRTFPVNGKFTPEQAEIYNIVLAAQEAGMKATRPGASIPDVHTAATEVIKDGLLRLGLITDKNTDQHRMWFMHGTSHWLGMNVHDVGVRGAKFEPGMVFTNEPGIYIRPDALDYLPDTPESQKFKATVSPAFEKYKGIGVRIEDDILVTADGYRNMSVALPRTIADIEAFIAKASKEMRASVTLPSLLPSLSARHGFVSIATGRSLAARELAHRHDDE